MTVELAFVLVAVAHAAAARAHDVGVSPSILLELVVENVTWLAVELRRLAREELHLSPVGRGHDSGSRGRPASGSM